MTETKAESQNYLANPYSTLAPLSLGSHQYVLSVLRFKPVFFFLPSPILLGFMLVTCQTATSEVSFDRSHSPPLPSPGWIVLPIRFINSFSLSPCIRSALIPVNIVADDFIASSLNSAPHRQRAARPLFLRLILRTSHILLLPRYPRLSQGWCLYPFPS